MRYHIDYINRYLNPDFRVGFHSFEPFQVSLRSFFDHEVDAYERRFKVGDENGNLILSLDLPGFKQGEVDVQLEKSVLTVRAKNEEDEIEQSITVGDDVDPDLIDAKLENGLLKLVLPRRESAKARKIAIK